MGSNDLMQALGLSHRPTFRNNYLNPALEDEWIERTQPDSPRSPTQRYRLTGKSQRWLLNHANGRKVTTKFTETLRKDQKAAVREIIFPVLFLFLVDQQPTGLIYPQPLSKESTPTGNTPSRKAAINPIQLGIVRFDSIQIVPARLHGAGERLAKFTLQTYQSNAAGKPRGNIHQHHIQAPPHRVIRN